MKKLQFREGDIKASGGRLEICFCGPQQGQSPTRPGRSCAGPAPKGPAAELHSMRTANQKQLAPLCWMRRFKAFDNCLLYGKKPNGGLATGPPRGSRCRKGLHTLYVQPRCFLLMVRFRWVKRPLIARPIAQGAFRFPAKNPEKASCHHTDSRQQHLPPYHPETRAPFADSIISLLGALARNYSLSLRGVRVSFVSFSHAGDLCCRAWRANLDIAHERTDEGLNRRFCPSVSGF